MAFFHRESPALMQILLKLYSAETPPVIDHQIYEFGTVSYHIQASASEPHHFYLSVSTSLQSPEVPTADGLKSYSTLERLKRVYSNAIDIIDPPEEGYQLTIKIKVPEFPQSKEECIKILKELASLQAMILSSQLKEMLLHLGSQDTTQGFPKLIKLVYHPGEPFFVIRLPEKISVIFPMRFRDDSDVLIATTLFQELVDVGCSQKFAKAPPCTWSPIPPPELRGESFEDLSTNGGFVSFDIFSRHIEGSKMDKTVWVLLNFNAYVKHHVKCTRGFIQRRMRKKVESLSEVLQKAVLTKNEQQQVLKKSHGRESMKKLVRVTKVSVLKRKCSNLVKKIMKIHLRIKIQGFDRFRQKWLKVPKFYSTRRYSKLS